MQLVALVDDQIIVLVPPLVTLVGFAAIVIVGAWLTTVTVVDCVAVPPAPVQLSVYVLVPTVVSVPVEVDPEVFCAPVHAPVAVQLVALVDDQVSVLAFPDTTVVGLAARVTVGGGLVTVTVVDCVAVPPEPVQLNVNVLVVVRAPVGTFVPEVDLVPDHAPLAVQLVAFVDDQVRALAFPETTVEGFAVSVTVGAGGTTVTVVDWVAVPPAPVHASVYVLLLVRSPVGTLLPEVPMLPDQAPLAVQLVALVDDHVSVLAPPIATVVGVALIETVGAAIAVAIADCVAVPPGPLHVSV